MQKEVTAPIMHLGRHPAAASKMAAGSLQLKQTKSWSSELRSPACPAHYRSGSANTIISTLAPPLSLGCWVAVPWGSRQPLCLGDKWLFQGCSPLGGGAWPPPAKEPLNEKRPRYPWQRPSLKVACPELHIL